MGRCFMRRQHSGTNARNKDQTCRAFGTGTSKDLTQLIVISILGRRFMRKRISSSALFTVAWCALSANIIRGAQQGDVAKYVPPEAPRTGILGEREQAFRDYCTKGEGAKPFEKIKSDFDKVYAAMPFPAEPLTYGDPAPKSRDSGTADRWRRVQDVCGVVSGVAEAATLIWVVTGEDKYFEKGKEFLIKTCAWHFEPEWQQGPTVGATD